MTDPTISTDPATLRDLAATLRMDEVRVCPHYLKLDLLADTYDAIAAEKEAQAAPAGDLVALVENAIEIGPETTEKPRARCHAENALRAIAAAGYEIRPRAYTAGERLGGGLVAVPGYPTPAMQAAGEAVADRHILLDDARTPYLSNDGVIEVWAHMLSALTEKEERS
jgi:hypothetical protein